MVFTFCTEIQKGLEDIGPLYTEEDFYVFNNYKDGVNYKDKICKVNFKMILQALKEKRERHLEFIGGKGAFVLVNISRESLIYLQRKL